MTDIGVGTIESLNDLIKTNNDRIETYRLAIKALNETSSDLIPLFNEMIIKSRHNTSVLAGEVRILGGEPGKGTSLEGKIFRAWTNFKSVFKSPDRSSVLANCELCEDAVIESYRAAIQSEELTDYLRQTISDQMDKLLHAHDRIKTLREISGPASSNEI